LTIIRLRRDNALLVDRGHLQAVSCFLPDFCGLVTDQTLGQPDNPSWDEWWGPDWINIATRDASGDIKDFINISVHVDKYELLILLRKLSLMMCA
jgi:hypothetical protein